MFLRNRKTSTKVEVSLINSNLTNTLQLSLFNNYLLRIFDRANVVSLYKNEVIETLTKKCFRVI